MSVLEQVGDILRDFFELDDLSVTRETTAREVDGWDSLAHVSFIGEVERAFDIRFRLYEVAALKNIGELVDLVEREQAK